MTTDLAIWIVGSLGLLGAIGSGWKAWLDRNSIRARANLDDTSATIALAAAARELLDPLRKELAAERVEHAADMDTERRKVAEVRAELEACTAHVRVLRGELSMARVEADELRRDREQYRAKVRDLERRLAERG